MTEPKRHEGRGRPSHWHERKAQILTKAAPSTTRGIAQAIVLKDAALFVVSESDGQIPFREVHGFGVYYHDCRFLDGYSFELLGKPLELLGSNARSGHEAIFELTNPELTMPDGQKVGKNEIAVHIDRVVDGWSLALEDEITIHSYSREEPVDLDLKLSFRAYFDDVYIVRGLGPYVKGDLEQPRWHDNELILSYRGKDDIIRSLTVLFSRPPDHIEEASASFSIRLAPRSREVIKVEISLAEAHVYDGAARHASKADVEGTHRRIAQHAASFRMERARVETDGIVLNAVLEQSFADLLSLRTPQDGETYFAAGVPWFTTLFGRDSIITALFMLPYHSLIAEKTLRLLAKYQGREMDTWRDEEPGKILHELRVGELANIGEIPDTPYYGTVDATALFLILLARHAAWTGRLDLFEELRPNADAALEWIARYGEQTRIEGYVCYHSEQGDMLVNQGWKDSGDALVDENGHIVEPPVALVEVQGYTYLAKTEIAQLYERCGQPDVAKRLRREADELRGRFNRDFWIPEREIYALALASGGQRASVNTSNPGHALFAGIADEDKAKKMARTFMTEEMFSGWGVRTLATNEKAYNPISYHRGTVWPHDNAFIVDGLRRYGFDHEAMRIADGIIAAASHFPLNRLPEVFSGFPRAGYETPIRYPVACHPQAWASGSVPFMIASLLGLEPDGFDNRLHVVRPILPPNVTRLEILGLAIGNGRADIAFHRGKNSEAKVSVLRTEGDIEVVCIEADKP